MGEYAVEKREITPKNFLLVISNSTGNRDSKCSYQGICTSND